eukprot:SAG31_NODE_10632_length_1114_cov_4.741872_1_plen_74_part_00
MSDYTFAFPTPDTYDPMARSIMPLELVPSPQDEVVEYNQGDDDWVAGGIKSYLSNKSKRMSGLHFHVKMVAHR